MFYNVKFKQLSNKAYLKRKFLEKKDSKSILNIKFKAMKRKVAFKLLKTKLNKWSLFKNFILYIL
jgi:predicted ATP-grasp superfamily ATP-dependent carboligase